MEIEQVGDFIRLGRFASKKGQICQLYVSKQPIWGKDTKPKFALQAMVKGSACPCLCEEFYYKDTAEQALQEAIEALK